MRDLLFKNITSEDRRKRRIAASEVSDRQGMRSVIHRHFIYMVREIIAEPKDIQDAPTVCIIKERNSREQKEKFFCKIKGSVFVLKKDRLFQVHFIHSLKICLSAASGAVEKCSEG